MDIIKSNYVIIIIVGLFLIFALIGYLIDMLRNVKNDNPKVEIPDEIKSVELTKVIENNNSNEKDNNPDDLLKNYEGDK